LEYCSYFLIQKFTDCKVVAAENEAENTLLNTKKFLRPNDTCLFIYSGAVSFLVMREEASKQSFNVCSNPGEGLR
jgi:hypothetical protein